MGILFGLAAIYTGDYRLIPMGIVCAYFCAWVSHFFIEMNRPATFKYPVWSFMGDQKMLLECWQGKHRMLPVKKEIKSKISTPRSTKSKK